MEILEASTDITGSCTCSQSVMDAFRERDYRPYVFLRPFQLFYMRTDYSTTSFIQTGNNLELHLLIVCILFTYGCTRGILWTSYEMVLASSAIVAWNHFRIGNSLNQPSLADWISRRYVFFKVDPLLDPNLEDRGKPPGSNPENWTAERFRKSAIQFELRGIRAKGNS